MFDFPKDPSWVIDDYIGVGEFVPREDASQRNIKQVSWFYATVSEIDELVRAINHYKRNGQILEARNLIKEKRSKLKYRKAFGKVRRDLTGINNKIKRIRRSALKPEIKRIRIDELTALRNRKVTRAYDVTDEKS